jgi:hypothetical protein
MSKEQEPEADRQELRGIALEIQWNFGDLFRGPSH